MKGLGPSISMGSRIWWTVASSSITPAWLEFPVSWLLEAKEREFTCWDRINERSVLHSTSRESILYFWRRRRLIILALCGADLLKFCSFRGNNHESTAVCLIHLFMPAENLPNFSYIIIFHDNLDCAFHTYKAKKQIGWARKSPNYKTNSHTYWPDVQNKNKTNSHNQSRPHPWQNPLMGIFQMNLEVFNHPRSLYLSCIYCLHISVWFSDMQTQLMHDRKSHFVSRSTWI